MPFIQDNNENNENENSQSPVMTGGGTGSLGAGGSTNAPPPMANQNKQGSGRFTNLNKYVTANQQGSANLANRLGTGITTQLDSKSNEASSSLNNATSAISGEGGAKSTLMGLNQQKDKFKTISNQFPQNQVQATDDLGTFTKAPEFNNFMKGLSGDAINENQLRNQVNTAGQNVSNFQNLFQDRQGQIASSTGRQQLLGEFVGGGQSSIRPAYSAGQKKLDQMILQQNPNNLKQLLNTVNSKQADVDSLNSNLNTAFSDVDNLVADEKAFMTGANADIAAAKTGFLSPLEQRAAQMNKENPELIARAQQDLTDETISGDLMSRFGLNEGQRLYGLNLSNYLSSDPTQVGINQAATDQERKYFSNLSNLLSAQDKTLINDQGKNVDPIKFNSAQFNKDLAQSEGDYNSAYNNRAIDLGGRVISTPGQEYTSDKIVSQMTPAQLEQWINTMKTLSFDDQMRNSIDIGAEHGQGLLDQWRNSNNFNRLIKRG